MTQIGLEDRDGDFDVDVRSVGSLGARQLRHGSLPSYIRRGGSPKVKVATSQLIILTTFRSLSDPKFEFHQIRRLLMESMRNYLIKKMDLMM